jgi:hypothetical protein
LLEWIAAALLPALSVAFPAPAQVPAGALAHGMPPGPRPIHRVLAEVDAIAIGTIGASDVGRIEVSDALAIVGAPDPAFQIKRAPSNPPAWSPGARALLLLRGAREPYVLADEPREQITVEGGADVEARVAVGLRTLHAALADPTRMRDTYLGWIEGPDEILRQQALRGLWDGSAPFQPLPADRTTALAAAALDAERTESVRRAAATAAILTDEGAAALLAGSPGTADAADAQVYEVAVQGGLLRRADGVVPALRRGLESPNAAVRSTAVRFGVNAGDAELAAQIASLATSDPDPDVRQAAAKVAGGR